jgi:hypothetical protein
VGEKARRDGMEREEVRGRWDIREKRGWRPYMLPGRNPLFPILISFFFSTGCLSLTYIKWRIVDHVIMNISYSLIKPYYKLPIPSLK